MGFLSGSGLGNAASSIATQWMGQAGNYLLNREQIEAQREQVDRTRASMPNVPTGSAFNSAQNNYNRWSRLQGDVQAGTDLQGNDSAFYNQQFKSANELKPYTDAQGNVDWKAAMKAGVDLSAWGIDPSNLSTQDRTDVALQSSAANRALYQGEYDRVTQQLGEQESRFGDIQGDIESGYHGVMNQLDRDRANASLRPGQVLQEGHMNYARLIDQQLGSMRDFLSNVDEGLGNLMGQRGEALSGIMSGLANTIGSATQAAKSDMRNQLAAIDNDPSIPPEQKEALKSQVRMQTGMNVADTASKTHAAFNELRAKTSSEFANTIGSYQSAARGAEAGLRAGFSGDQARLAEGNLASYTSALNHLSSMDAEFTSIQQRAENERAANRATLESYRTAANMMGNTYLSTVLSGMEDDTSDILDFYATESTALAQMQFQNNQAMLGVMYGQQGVEQAGANQLVGNMQRLQEQKWMERQNDAANQAAVTGATIQGVTSMIGGIVPG